MNSSKEIKKFIDETEKEWIEKLDKEEEKEKEIEKIIDTVVDLLYKNNKRCRVSAFNKVFDIGLVINPKEQVAILAITDEARFKIAGNKYKPLQVKGEFDRRYPIKYNIRAMVEGWIRHITGTVKIETLEEENQTTRFKRGEN